MEPFTFVAADRFVNRERDLARMEQWWDGDDPNALTITGRRRVGKSWLVRRFAHGKPAVILVAERLAATPLLNRFAAALAPHFGGAAPQIGDVPELFRLLYALGREQRRLVVVDELPYLLPREAQARERMLTAIQAVMEERDASQTKLVLCGSHISVMEALTAAGSGLSGRLTSLPVVPLTLAEAAPFAPADDAVARIERYAVTGGMARYLAELGGTAPLGTLVRERVLDPRGSLFNDPRDVLEQELAQTANYYALIELLARKRQLALGDLASVLGRPATALPPYLETLAAMRLVERRAPFGARPGSKHGRYRLSDPFLRFWFRFVFAFQEDLAAGLSPQALWDGLIARELPSLVAPEYESLCRRWVRERLGDVAPRVGSWWGPAAPAGKAAGRGSEEIDVVGGTAGRVTLVGECKWTTDPLDVSLLGALEQWKLPALRRSHLKVAVEPRVVLFCRGGFTDGLRERAAADPKLRLVGVEELVADLTTAPVASR